MKRFLKILSFVVVGLTVSGICHAAAQEETAAFQAKKLEIEALVQKAAEYAKVNGKAAALKEFMRKGSVFHQGEIYLYAYDFSGTVVFHGGQPDLVGKSLVDMQDPNGVKVVQELIRLAGSGQGWLEYLWPNPVNKNRIETKFGFVAKVDESWFVGSGFYGVNSSEK